MRQRKHSKEKYYAVYQGDKFLYLGTKKECAEYFGVKRETITFWISPAHHKRAKNTGRLAIVVEED